MTHSPLVKSKEILGDLLARGQTAALAHNLLITPHEGINRNVQFHLPDGTSWLLKEPRVDFRTGTLASGVDREGWFYEQVWRSDSVEHLRAFIPELVHYDAEHHSLFLKYLEGWENLNEYHRRTGRYPMSLARRIAELLASVHGDSFAHPEKYSEFRSRAERNPIHISLLSIRVTPEEVAECPEDGAKLVSLVQKYPEIAISLDLLKDAWQPICLIHKDIKLNNFMKSPGAIGQKGTSLLLLDWEFWDWGDPAWDVGAVLGNYLVVWLSSLDVSKSRSVETWFSGAKIPFGRVRPAINAFWTRYVDLCGPILHQRHGFSKLVIQYAGMFLLTRIMVALMEQGYLTVQSLCILQVAKNLVVEPERYSDGFLVGYPL